uniref:Uncharacterized protein n=1 Tax=Ectopseudomonas oleovorans TaxID=301 RepID=A0A653BD58_ECTOL
MRVREGLCPAKWTAAYTGSSGCSWKAALLPISRAPLSLKRTGFTQLGAAAQVQHLRRYADDQRQQQAELRADQQR